MSFHWGRRIQDRTHQIKTRDLKNPGPLLVLKARRKSYTTLKHGILNFRTHDLLPIKGKKSMACLPHILEK